MDFLLSGIQGIIDHPEYIIMYLIGALLIYLAIVRDLEPALLLPMGFGAILVNLPASGVLTQQLTEDIAATGIIEWLFNVGIEASEAMPLLLFIGIGAMIDFGPLLSNPKMFLFGAASQFGIFVAIFVAGLMMRQPSALSARRTDLQPFWSQMFLIRNIWVPLLWWHTPIWRWFPLYSQR